MYFLLVAFLGWSFGVNLVMACKPDSGPLPFMSLAFNAATAWLLFVNHFTH